MVGADGKLRNMVTLPLAMVPGWMMITNANKVAPALRPRIILFQEEAFPALYNHFFGDRAETVTPAPIGHRELTPSVIGGIVKGIVNKRDAEQRRDMQALLQHQIDTFHVRVAPAVNDAISQNPIIVGLCAEIAALKTAQASRATAAPPPPPPRQPAEDDWLTMNAILEHIKKLEWEGLSNSCSARLRRWDIGGRVPDGVRKPDSDCKLSTFRRDTVREWLRVEGRALIRARNDKFTGQDVLRLVTKRKGLTKRPTPTARARRHERSIPDARPDCVADCSADVHPDGAADQQIRCRAAGFLRRHRPAARRPDDDQGGTGDRDPEHDQRAAPHGGAFTSMPDGGAPASLFGARLPPSNVPAEQALFGRVCPLPGGGLRLPGERGGPKASTIGCRAAAIRYGHHLAGHEPPTSADTVLAVIRRHRHGARPQGSRDRRCGGRCPDSLAGKRDRAFALSRLRRGRPPVGGFKAARTGWLSHRPRSDLRTVSQSGHGFSLRKSAHLSAHNNGI
jgi:hypothetical protein